MYKNRFFSILAIVFLLTNMSSYGQEINGSMKRKADQADMLFSSENYWEALPLYKELAEANPSNVKFNNRAGICYYYSSHKTKCIPFFESAIKNWGKDTVVEVYYYLGTAYQMENKFDKAIECFNTIKTLIKPEKNGTSTLNEVDRSIEMCNNGKKFVRNPSSVRIFNLGPSINTNDPEYAPVISADESKIIFTSKRKEGTGSMTTPDGYYYEDIYIADKISQGWQVQVLDSTEKKTKHSLFYIFWSKARKIGNSINTKDHDAAISLSPDGKNLFLYRDNFIYESKFDGKKWLTPTKLNDNVNEKRSFQPSCSMTSDGKLLYIVSDRPAGVGGKDIYISNKQADGNWGLCKNLGPEINTEYDEDSPFITSDGKTLYFSSQGHNSMGGYDIFKSELVNEKWTKPQNLGYPTNTGADDIFFVMNADQTRAYLSTIKTDTYGDYDIYVLSFVPETHLFASVKEGNSIAPFNTSVTARGHKSELDTATYNIYETAGHYKLALLSPDEYTLTVGAPAGFKTHPIDVKVPNQNYKKTFYNEVNFETIPANETQPLRQVTTFYAAFFNVDSVVNADPMLSAMSKKAAYSAMVKMIDPNNTTLNFKVFTFTDILVPEAYLYAAVKEGEKVTPVSTVVSVKSHQSDLNSYTQSGSIDKLTLLAPGKYTITVQTNGYKAHPVDVVVPIQNYKKPFYTEINYENLKNAAGKQIHVTTFYSALFDVDSVVKADPKLARIADPKAAYSAMVKSIDQKNTNLNFKVFSFTDLIDTTLDVIASAIEKKTATTPDGAVVTNPSNSTTNVESIKGVIGTTNSTVAPALSTSTATVNGKVENVTTAIGPTGATATTPTTTVATEAKPTTTTTVVDTKPTTTVATDTKSTTTVASSTKPSTKGTADIKTATGVTGTTGTTNSASSTNSTNTTSAGSTETAEIRTFDAILFDYSKTLIREDVKPELEDIYNYLKINKNLTLEVYGHADAKGSDTYNLALSMKRAKITVNYFVSKGINANRLKALGKGKLQPVAPNENPDKSDNPEGRQKNRRVEFKIVALKKTEKK